MRHPFYSAYLCAFVACALATAHVVPSACLGVVTILYFLAARMEEQKFLGGALCAQYADYRRRTGMFVPKPWALFGNREGA